MRRAMNFRFTWYSVNWRTDQPKKLLMARKMKIPAWLRNLSENVAYQTPKVISFRNVESSHTTVTMQSIFVFEINLMLVFIPIMDLVVKKFILIVSNFCNIDLLELRSLHEKRKQTLVSSYWWLGNWTIWLGFWGTKALECWSSRNKLNWCYICQYKKFCFDSSLCLIGIIFFFSLAP